MSTPAEAVIIVEDGWSKFSALASSSFAQAQSYVDQLHAFNVVAVPLSVNFNVDSTLGSPFTPPAAPAQPNIAVSSIGAPTALSLAGVPTPALLTMPTDIPAAPALNFPQLPGALQAQAPGAAPQFTVPVLPVAPTIVFPSAPSSLPINLPAVPQVVLPTFAPIYPATIPPPPATVVNYVEPAYKPVIQTQVLATLNGMLAGTTGLPPAIEQQLFDRARAREDITSQRAVDDALNEWASRGFSLPPGELAKRISAARQGNQNAISGLNRDITIQIHNQQIAALQFAVTNGIALEGQLMVLFNEVQDRAVNVLKLTLDISIQVYNLQVTYYSTQLDAVKVQAQVYQSQIEAQKTQVDIYRSEVEAQQIIGQINSTNVQAYAESVRALLAMVDVYKAQIEGVNAQVEVDNAVLNGYRATVDAFTAQVNAYRAQNEAYSAGVQGQLGVVQSFESQVRAYAEKVRAYQIGTEASLANPRFAVDMNRVAIEKYRGDVDAFSAQVKQQSDLVNSSVQIFEGQARMYSAQLGAEQERVLADARQFELSLESAKAQASYTLDTVRLQVQQLESNSGQLLEALRGAASTSQALAASAMAGVHLAAGISQSDSTTTDLTQS